MSIFAIADATWGIVGVADHQAGKPPFNNTFNSIVGNSTTFTIGAGTISNTYSSSLTAVTDLQEMLRLFFNFSPKSTVGNFLLNQLVYNSGGGSSSYVFGPSKSIGYRLSRNFTSDRYCRTKGLFREGVSTTTSLQDHVKDVTWQPKEPAAEKKHMVLPIFFSLSLLISDLCIVYKLKTVSSVQGKDKSLSGGPSPDSKTSNEIMLGLVAYESVFIQLLEVVERFLCSRNTAENGAKELEKTVEELKAKVEAVTDQETKVTTVETSTDVLKTNLVKVEKTAQEAEKAAGAAKRDAEDAVSNIQAALPRLGKLEEEVTDLQGFKEAGDV